MCTCVCTWKCVCVGVCLQRLWNRSRGSQSSVINEEVRVFGWSVFRGIQVLLDVVVGEVQCMLPDV